MTRIAITAAGHRFIAETNPDAPQTVAAFLKLLPYQQKLIHVRWSGEGCWVPLGDFQLGVGFENHTSHPSMGDILWNVGLPRALPYLFASLKIAITLAFVGTVLAETVAANKGIGNVMMIASGNFDVPMVFAGLVILAVMGVMLYAVSSFVESRMTGWAQRKNEVVMA